MGQKGLKMHKNRQKIEFLDLKRRFFSLAELGGTPIPPLRGGWGYGNEELMMKLKLG